MRTKARDDNEEVPNAEESDERLRAVYGLYEATDTWRWSLFCPRRGDVIVVKVPIPVAPEEGVYGAFAVLTRTMLSDGSLILAVKSLGSSNAATTVQLSRSFNRRPGCIHICHGIGECEVLDEEVVFHSKTVELADGATFSAPYVGASGRRMLKQVRDGLEGDGEEPEPGETPEGHLPEPMADPAKDRERREKAGKGDGGTTKTPETPYGQLREKLDRVKRKQQSQGIGEAQGEEKRRPLERVMETPWQVPHLSSNQKLGNGNKEDPWNLRNMMMSGGPADGRQATSTPIMNGWTRATGSTSVGSQLVLRAAANLQGQGGGGGTPPGGGLMAYLNPSGKRKKKKKKKDKKKKKKKKKKSKRPSGGGSSGGGSSGGSSSTTSDSDESSGSGSSGGSAFLPLLRRKAEKKPGSVLKLLLAQVESQLSELQGAEDHPDSALLGGTKMLTYFHLLVRGNGVQVTSRDGRELYLLAVLLDLLRSGQLERLADGMSARFMALQTAVMDGSWAAARHLEVYTPDQATPGGPAITLAARKHAKVLEKVKGSDSRGDQRRLLESPVECLAMAEGRRQPAPRHTKRKREERQARKRQSGNMEHKRNSFVERWLRRRIQRRRQRQAIREGDKVTASPRRSSWGSFEEIISKAKSLKELGVSLWLILVARRAGPEEGSAHETIAAACRWWEKFSRDHRVFRVRRALFPLSSCWSSLLADFPNFVCSEEIFEDPQFCERFAGSCWCELVVLFLNHLYNGSFGFGPDECSKAQKDLLRSIDLSVKRWLKDDCELRWNQDDVIADLGKKVVSYSGEEICKAEPLSVFRVSPALPPEGHGGSIECSSWVSGKSRWYLENPDQCLLPDTGQPLPRLQARVHIQRGEEKELGELLVRRNICCWTPEDRVLRYRGQMVLNGLFGVPKSTILSNHQSALRCIMNLIPSNSVLRAIPGRVARLPGITQWLNVCLEGDETVRLCQSDMVSAFYLFRVPRSWAELLTFNLSFTGEELGFPEEKRRQRFYLSCQVLPMGWTSAVGVMQQIAEEVLHRGGIPSDQQIVRGLPIPAWLVGVRDKAERERRVWWHVYLDNYASGEKLRPGERPCGGRLQQRVEVLWAEAGIISSKGKSVTDHRGVGSFHWWTRKLDWCRT